MKQLILMVSLGLIMVSGCKTGGETPQPPPGGSFVLTVVVKGNGSVSAVEGIYNAGETISVSASPGQDTVLGAWRGSDDDDSFELTNTVTMDESKTLTVIFLPPGHNSPIRDIDALLDSCPQDDPAYLLIRHDFEILLNGAPLDGLSCTPPVTALPWNEYTDELMVIQALRVIYRMDYGQSGHLPWTPGTLYRWMRLKIRGLDIRNDIEYTNCCLVYNDLVYIAYKDLRNVIDKEVFYTWRGIGGIIGLLAHETRHVDGYLHVSCCGIDGGCDADYDENDLSSYGIQWFLYKAWLMGEINIGISCLPQNRIDEISSWLINQCNRPLYRRFCYTPPPILNMPAEPGGPCL